MDTPLNVQSVTQQVLQDQQATTLAQALQNVSGVSVAPGLSSNFSGFVSSGIYVRGFLSGTYYRDGFRVDSTISGFDAVGDRQLANIASVDVLKGPGAILYGLVEPGGIVNLTTKEPLNAPYYAVEQQVGSLGFYRTTVNSTGPLTKDDTLLYRMNMSYENNGAPFGAFVDNTHSQNIFMAPVLKWNIDAATWVKLEAEYGDNRNNLFTPFDPVLNGNYLNIPRSTNYGDSPSYRQSSLFSALTWSHEFDKDWSIKQQIAFDHVMANPTSVLGQYAFNNFPPFAFPVVGQLVEQTPLSQQVYSTNIDLKGHINTFGAEHTLLLGGDIYRTTFVGSGNVPISGTPLVSLFNPVQPGVPPVTCPCFPFASYDTQNTAGLYLQDQVKLPYNFFVLAGARYQYIRQTSESGSALDDLNNSSTPPPPLVGQAVTPRFGLLWRPQSWLSLYGNYTEGFGPNNQGLIFPGTLPAPTSARSWEAGAKIELFDGKLRASADYFELVKTNVPFGDPAHPGYVLLVGEARSTGPEVDIQGEILPGWNVIATYTNDDVRITKGSQGQNGGGGQAGGLSVGERFPFVPRNKASLWTTYEFQDAAWKGLKLGAGYVYSGSTPVYDATVGSGGDPPGVFRDVPGAGVVNLMGAYSFNYAGSKMTAQLNVNNVLDRTYYTAATNAAPVVPGLTGGASFRSYGAPFSVLGSLRAELDKGAAPPAFMVPRASPLSPGFDWTGFYVGGHIGYGWGDNYGAVSFASAGGFNGQTSSDGDAQGTIGGVHLGYNHQFDRWVIGVEGSVDGTTLNKSLLLLYPDPASIDPFGSIATGTVKSEIQGSIRARAGVSVFDRLLIYGTGGVAFGSFYSDLQLTGSDLVGLFAASGTASAVKTGWTAGGGLEWAINNHWSLRGEYRHSDFGSLAISPGLSSIGAAFAADRHLAQDQVQVGFSYRFGGSEPAPAPNIVKGPLLAANTVSKPAGVAPVVPPPPGPPPVINWTGFYAGAQIGYGWGDNDGSITYATPGGLAGQSNLGSSAIVVGGSSNYNGDATGVIGGVHLGYNKQFDKWVVGLEGAVDPTLLSRRVSINVPDAAADPTGALGIGATATGAIWSTIQGSVRARAGYAMDRMLFYGTGGVAIGAFGSNFQVYGTDTTLAPFYAADQRSTTRAGWTVGGGVEYAVNPHWSVRGEYRYTDFGHIGDLPAASTMGVAYAADRHLDQNQVQVGFSYKFGEWVAPVPVAAKY